MHERNLKSKQKEKLQAMKIILVYLKKKKESKS